MQTDSLNIQGTSAAVSLSRRQAWCVLITVLLVVFTVLDSLAPMAGFWAAITLFLSGVPHGAVERLPGHRRVRMPTLAYTALYIVFGIVIYSSWLISPTGTLLLFLGLSAWHFADSEPQIRAFGLWVVLGSGLIYPYETLAIFSQLTDAQLVSPVAKETFRYIAVLSLVVLACETIYRRWRGAKLDLFRIAALLAVFILLPPIPAVAVYFFAFHSLGEMRRTIDAMTARRGRFDLRAVAHLYAPAALPALMGAGVILWAVWAGYVPILLAAGLAVAFIIPHMLPVEKLLEADRRADP